jgi:hypothetical protein
MGTMPWDRDGNIQRAMTLQLRAGYPAKEEWLGLGENPALRAVWKLMKECWEEDPSDRPAPTEIVTMLEGLADNTCDQPRSGDSKYILS